MGLVSDFMVAATAMTAGVALTGRDRTVFAMVGLVAANLALSLLVQWTVRGIGRSNPLMLLDSAALYVMCLTAVCRLDRPLWLYGLCVATAMECLAHLAYVVGWLPRHGHTLMLNLLFGAQLACLIIGRWAAPEDEALKAPLPDLGVAA